MDAGVERLSRFRGYLGEELCLSEATDVPDKASQFPSDGDFGDVAVFASEEKATMNVI